MALWKTCGIYDELHILIWLNSLRKTSVAAGSQRRALSLKFFSYHSVSRLSALARTDFWSIFKTSTVHTFCFCTWDFLRKLLFHSKTQLPWCVECLPARHICLCSLLQTSSAKASVRGHARPVWDYYSVHLSEYNGTRSNWSLERSSVCNIELEPLGLSAHGL